jgi:hypothetical protein
MPFTMTPEFKRAEDAFKAVYDIATKRHAASKKKVLFGALIGMVCIILNKKHNSSASFRR